MKKSSKTAPIESAIKIQYIIHWQEIKQCDALNTTEAVDV